MEPKYNLWIEHDGVVVLSAWRVDLLEAIDAAGSISAAAEQQSAATQEMSAASADLLHVAERLRELVSGFRV